MEASANPNDQRTLVAETVSLVASRGEAFPLPLLASRLRCPECGSRQIMVLFHPPPHPGRTAATGSP
jgi:hypothetical protein